MKTGKITLFHKPEISVTALRTKCHHGSGCGLSVLTCCSGAQLWQLWGLCEQLSSPFGGWHHCLEAHASVVVP